MLLALKRRLRVLRRRFTDWITGERGPWPPQMDKVIDWECGYCGARKSEIIKAGTGCQDRETRDGRGSTACPMWPVHGD